MTAADDSHWEPDGVTLQVRFCEGRAVRSNSNVRRDYSPERAFFSAPTDSAVAFAITRRRASVQSSSAGCLLRLLT